MISKTAIAFTLAAIVAASTSRADDWPQFRGPSRDGKSAETHLLRKWPRQGPTLIFSIKGVGQGYSTPAVADRMIYVTGLLNNRGIISSLDLQGNLKWAKDYGPEWTRSVPGVRCTPTVDQGRLYIVSGMGAIICYDAKTGNRIWSIDAVEKFGARFGPWGIAESPLIDGNNIICTPGAENATMVALDKTTGKTVWTCKIGDQKSCYCSPILANTPNRRLIVTMLEDVIAGVDAETGKLLWTDAFADYQEKPNAINPVSPIYHKGCIYATSGYDDGGVMLELSPDASAVRRKWTETSLDCHHSGVVLVDGHIYGSNYFGVFDGAWVCLDWATGKQMYMNRWANKGPIIFADGMLYCYDEEKGNLALVKPDPSPLGFEPVSTFQITAGTGKHWAHPAISDRVLYIRHGDALMAFDIANKPNTR